MTQTHQQTPVPGLREVDAVVVGAGLSGLYMLHRLRKQGLTVQVYEIGDGVGGTWDWSRYPGARVSVQSMDCSPPFGGDLEQEWEWPDKYPPQEELRRCINPVADRLDL